jgi:transposase
MILYAEQGKECETIATLLDVEAQSVRRFRKRWSAREARLLAAEAAGAHEKDLERLIVDALSDAYRSGSPGTFTMAQKAEIIALACEAPSTFELPITHWTPRELVRVAVRLGIVASISERHVGRILEEADVHPHRMQYWLNPKTKGTPEYREQVEQICTTYLEAPALQEQGVHTVSTDEKTGIQALERIAPTLPTQPGRCAKIEYEYERHGTLCLIANFDVATGRVLEPMVQPTRTEADFLKNIQKLVGTAPHDRWVFVADQLNTHGSESLVRFVAEIEGLSPESLGKKGKDGILHNQKSRRAFLSDPTHRIRFVYTPKHCSWLNQVEIWFSILSRRALKRGSFASTLFLEKALRDFIEYYNQVLAKPFRWTFTGKPLTA